MEEPVYSTALDVERGDQQTIKSPHAHLDMYLRATFIIYMYIMIKNDNLYIYIYSAVTHAIE